ncbi:MAG TPA: PAS domain-containing protein, partial [Vicinamibacterales bacterium]|nr:PAS domain-containing protein [Vicinamibacterales bacterium]
MILGALVLVGWSLDLAVLKGLAGGITMKPNAAVGLLASGLALFFIVGPRPSRTAARISALVPGFIGVATLSEHIVGWDLGIDQLLFSEPPGAAGTASPGRMGPNAALNLTLAAAAVWCLSRDGVRAAIHAQALASCMAALALVPTVGYLYGARELYAIARYTGIALHTGVAILILSAGILAARSNVGPVSALMSDAAHGVMARRLLVPAIAVPLLLGYIRVTGERRGWFDVGLGVSMFVVAVIVLLSITIWHTAVALARSDVARQTAEEALTETQQRFRSMADQAPILIWVEEAAARPWFNKRWYTFTGAAPGLDWEALVHPDDLAALRAVRDSAVREHASYSHQYRLKRADGRFAWVLERASPRVPGQASAGYVGSCIDITDLRQVQHEREELLVLERAAREKAEQADRAKEEF